MNLSSWNWQQVVRTHMSGRLWCSWHWLTYHHPNKLKMRWVSDFMSSSTDTQKYHASNFNYRSRVSFSYHIFSSGLVIVTAKNQVKTPWGFSEGERGGGAERSSSATQLKVIESDCHRGRVRFPSAISCYWKTSCALGIPGVLVSSFSI